MSTKTKKVRSGHQEVKPFKVHIEPYNPDGYGNKSEAKKTL